MHFQTAIWALIVASNILRCLFLIHTIVLTFFMEELQSNAFVIYALVKYLVSGSISMSLYLEAKWKFSAFASFPNHCNPITGSIFYTICDLPNFLWGSTFCLTQVTIHISSGFYQSLFSSTSCMWFFAKDGEFSCSETPCADSI